MSTIELVSKVRELKELQAMAEEIQAMAEELQAEINSIQDAIKAEMSARGVDEMVHNHD